MQTLNTGAWVHVTHPNYTGVAYVFRPPNENGEVHILTFKKVQTNDLKHVVWEQKNWHVHQIYMQNMQTLVSEVIISTICFYIGINVLLLIFTHSNSMLLFGNLALVALITAVLSTSKSVETIRDWKKLKTVFK